MPGGRAQSFGTLVTGPTACAPHERCQVWVLPQSRWLWLTRPRCYPSPSLCSATNVAVAKAMAAMQAAAAAGDDAAYEAASKDLEKAIVTIFVQVRGAAIPPRHPHPPLIPPPHQSPSQQRRGLITGLAAAAQTQLGPSTTFE